MPKVKTHSGAKKRFKTTAYRQVQVRVTSSSATCSPVAARSVKRQARNAAYVSDAHHHQIDDLLPYAK